MRKRNLVCIVLGTAIMLMIPLVAMLFTDEVKWDLTDFATIGALLVGAGFLFERVASKASTKYRPVAAVMVIVAVLLVWIELAVGLFD